MSLKYGIEEKDKKLFFVSNFENVKKIEKKKHKKHEQ